MAAQRSLRHGLHLLLGQNAQRRQVLDELDTLIGRLDAPDAAARLRIAEANRRHKAKLTWEKVREIRSRPEPASQLEPIYGVSKTLINNIRGYRAWVEPSNPFAALF